MTTFARHVLELLGAAVVLAGPLPLCVAVARAAPGLAERALTALVAWCALQAGIALALALAGWLTVGPLLAVELGLLALALPAAHRTGWPACPRPALAPAEWCTLAAIAVLGATLLLAALARPVTEHDSLGYHLPAMARWVHAGALLPLERTDQIGRYPYGWELLSALVVLPLREDLLVGLPNLIAWAILGLAIHCVARALGAPRLHAMAAAYAVLALPVTREQVGTLHVDLALAAFVLAGVRFALARDAPLLLIALGLAAAVKTSGVVYGALLLAAFALAPRPGVPAPPRPPGALAVALAAALCAGGVWYLRNLAQLGNPLGLVRVALGDVTLLPGSLEPAAIRRGTLAALFDATQPAHWGIVARVAWQALGLPGCLLAVAALGLLRPATRPRRPVRTVAVLFVLCVVAYVATPFSGDNGAHGWRLTPWMREGVRYALPALGLLGALGAVGAGRTAGAGSVVLAVVVVSAAAADAYTPGAAVLVGLAAAALLVRSPAPAAAAAALLCLAVVWGSSVLRDRRSDERRQRWPVAERLAAALPPGAAVGHIATAFSYPLYGPRFTNRVTFVPSTSDDREAWIATLRARGVALVAVGPLVPHQRRRRELAWLADPLGPFERIAGDDPVRETVLYRLRI